MELRNELAEGSRCLFINLLAHNLKVT